MLIICTFDDKYKTMKDGDCIEIIKQMKKT